MKRERSLRPQLEQARRLNKALGRGEDAFIKALMAIVREHGFSLMARRTGIGRSLLYKYARGDAHPRFEALVRIATACDLKFKLAPARPLTVRRSPIANPH